MNDNAEQVVWQGGIRLHDSLHSYISEIEEQEEGLTLLTIRDGRFRFPTGLSSEDFPPQTSNQKGKRVPGIFIWLRAEKLENWMDCSAVYSRRSVKKGLRGIDEFIFAKGFVLSRSTGNNDSASPNTVFALRIQGNADTDFKVESRGIASFCTGSQVQTPDSKTRGTSSRTYVVISSNEKPFVAYIRRSQGIKKLICNSESIRETSVEDLDKQADSPFEEEPIDLFRLKLRLLKGEITKAEFELKRTKLESA